MQKDLWDDDPLDILSVSGFYGPGAWLAWILSLSSTWYTLISRKESSQNLDLISSLLYTNWAALDLLMRIFRGSARESYGSFAAAVTITAWGFWHIIGFWSYLMQGGEYANWRRSCILLLGSIVPGIALVVLWSCPSTTIYSKAGAELISLSFPRYQFRGFEEPQLSIFGLIFHTLTILLVGIRWRKQRPILPGIEQVALMTICVSSLATTILTSHGYGACYVVPCAPQAVTEWDQLFAVLGATIALSYQLVPDNWPRVRDALWRAAGYIIWGDSRSLQRLDSSGQRAPAVQLNRPRPVHRIRSIGV